MSGDLEAEFKKRKEEANAPFDASDELRAKVGEMVSTGARTCAEAIRIVVQDDPRLAQALSVQPFTVSDGNFKLELIGKSFDVSVDGQISYNVSKAMFDRPDVPGWTSFDISATVTAHADSKESASERVDAHFEPDGSAVMAVGPVIEAAVADLALR